MPQVKFEEFVAKVSSGDYLSSFPTDTVPALAVRPDRAELIYQVKQRSLDKPLILMAGEIADLWDYVAGSVRERQIWQEVATTFLPGALTLVLPASPLVPAAMNPKDPTTIGVRVPDHTIARQILAATGPLATTSANRSGQPALQTLPQIEAEFPQVLTLFPGELQQLDPGFQIDRPGSGIPSTVVRWTGQGWQVLRQGAVQLGDLG